jgi:hypothetical protein
MILNSYTAEELIREAQLRERRRIMQERMDAAIKSKPVDYTGDLFDQYHAAMPLFAPPPPKPNQGE